MEKLQKIERFESLEQAIEQYGILFDAYEERIRNEESYHQLYDYECKRAARLEAKLNAISSIVNL